MDRLKLLAGATAPFAHLLGLRRAETAVVAPAAAAPAAKADDKKEDKTDDAKKARRADESDDDYAKRMAEEDDDTSAEEDDDDTSASEDDDDDGDKDKAVKAAVAAERARCVAIFSARSASIRPDVAATLAFTTDLSAADAIAAIDASAAGMTRRKGLHERMSAQPATPNPGVGGASVPSATPGSGNEAAALAAKILAAGGGVGVLPAK